MGSYQSLYLGPFVRCEKEIVEKEKTVNGCPHCKKGPFSGQFCSSCGAKQGSYNIKVKELKVIGNQIYNDLDDKLVPVASSSEIDKKYEFFISNSKLDGIDRKMNLDGDESGATPVAPPQIEREVQAFKTQFEKQLEWINSHYQNKQIEWGLIISWA